MTRTSSASREPQIALSVAPADEIKTTTCYMCACRCGIRVHLKDGKVRYIEGNRDHPVNRGVLCGKGSAGIMQHYSPARLRAPLLRVGERGSGEFKEISWDEALKLAGDWLGEVRRTDPRRLAFFTGRDQSQSLTGWWAIQYGTPNYAAHGGFCSVNMAAAGLYTFGGSFWEFGDPDWEHTRYFMLFGVAEDHASNPIKIGLGKLKQRGAKVVAINPVRTGYNAIADEWIGIKPGTDGLFVGALIHELLRTQKVDLDYLVRYSNAPWLVVQNPGAADDGLIVRDAEGRALAYDRKTKTFAPAQRGDLEPALSGVFELPDGRKAVPVFELLAKRYLSAEYSPERAEKETGIAADDIRRIAAELAQAAFEQEVVLDVPWTDIYGRRHDKMVGRPVSMHAMRGISAHSNGFHTCRMIHLLQILLGTIDCPGGFRYKPPYPKCIPPRLKPRGKLGEVLPEEPLGGPHLGFPTGPEDLLVDKAGRPQRLDKAFSWDAPLAAHGLMHMVITNAALGTPYPIEVLFMYMANMSWNSAMNTADTLKYLTEKDSMDRRLQDPAHHLFRRLLLRDGALRGFDSAGHHLSRTLGLHFAARPADLGARWTGGRHPPPGGQARPRCASVPGRADRSGRPAQIARLHQRRRQPEISGRLSRLHRAPRAPARYRPARRLARQGRQRVRHGRCQPAPARPLHRQRLVLHLPFEAQPALLQARQQGLPRLGGVDGLSARRCPSRLRALFGAVAEVSAGRPRSRCRAAAGHAPRAHRDLFRSAAVLVSAVRR